jgi:hypothetical protein
MKKMRKSNNEKINKNKRKIGKKKQPKKKFKMF